MFVNHKKASQDKDKYLFPCWTTKEEIKMRQVANMGPKKRSYFLLEVMLRDS